MSAALENTSPPSMPSLSQSPTSSLFQSEVIEVPVLAFTVTISFTSENGIWVAHSDHENLPIPQDTLAQIKWILQAPASHPEIELRFKDPALFFPIEQRNAPMVVTSDPLASQTECVAIWSNFDSKRRGTYRYSINVKIGNQDVTHDPTVENDPPI